MTEDIQGKNGLAAVIDAAREGRWPVTLDPTKPTFIVAPEGTRAIEVDMSAWRDAPARTFGRYCPATVDSFESYVGHHHAEEWTTVWVHPSSGRIVAIIDDNAAEGPAWRDHTAVLQLQQTPEWTHWTGADGKMMSQEEFAEHVEVGTEDIVEPDAADVLELAQSFHATSSSTFRQATRLQTGETQFQYDESITASAGATGMLAIPQGLLLGISPFVGEDPYRLYARFRYRLSSGKLTLGYRLDRPDKVIRDALDTITERLIAKFPLTYVGEVPGI